MDKIILFTVLCLTLVAAQTTPPRTLNIRCNFVLVGQDYDCVVDQAATLNDLNLNVVFYGRHIGSRTNVQVTRLRIENSFMPLIIPQAFSTFPQLRVYSFTSAFPTNMKRIQSNAFLNSTNLQELIVTHAGLAMINSNGLSGTNILRRLDLHNNQLTEIPDTLLSNSFSLEFIDLSNNHIGSISPGFFNVPIRLAHINLGNNQLLILPAALLNQNRVSLVMFHAHSNRITQIGNNFLTLANTQLTNFNLAGNTCIQAANWTNIGVPGGTTVQQIMQQLNPCLSNV